MLPYGPGSGSVDVKLAVDRSDRDDRHLPRFGVGDQGHVKITLMFNVYSGK